MPVADKSISGLVWYDRNRNGFREPDERGLAGVTIRVSGDGFSPLTTVTAADGTYVIQGLTPGDYLVSARTVDQPTNGDRDRTVSAVAGSSNPRQDFGYATAKVLGITSERESELSVDDDLALTGAQSLMLLATALILVGTGGLLIDRRRSSKR